MTATTALGSTSPLVAGGGPGMTAAEVWTGWWAMTVTERKAFVSTLVGLGLVSLRQAAALTNGRFTVESTR